MKTVNILICTLLMASAGSVLAAPLDRSSKAPDWERATQAEKDAWIAAFQFKQQDIDRAEVAACLDEHAAKPLFKESGLPGVTAMCGTIAALPD